MKKEIIVCDICERGDDDDDDDDDIKQCIFCKADVCSACSSELILSKNIVCSDCFDIDELEKETNKFFNSKEIKEQYNDLIQQLKDTLLKIVMVKKLKDSRRKNGKH
jgi:hypothetical protein